MVLNSKQRQVGRDNFADAAGVTRRQFLAGAAAIPTAASLYWGYEQLKGDPVRAGIIGCGDQGNYAHLSQSNQDYIRFVAFSDIRPSSQARTWKTLHDLYGEDAKNVKLYENYQEMLAQEDIELIVVALPLHLHAKATIDALSAGKHVLCEKLMAKTITECKEMVRASDAHKRLLAIGHQRHYSYLYANALSILQQREILGDVKHIRAYWHRNQTGNGADDARTGKHDGWHRAVPGDDTNIDFAAYGYKSLDELISWRLFDRTGGGLMVELGSHQLDAASIFLGKVHPVAVLGSGVNSFFDDNREVHDHIFLTFEFPQEIVVTYSSICTNRFDGYGEQVMGTRGTMVVQEELDAYLFREGGDRDTRVKWAEDRMGRPTVASGSTAAWAAGVGKADTLTSRGYREQQEHLCWIIRNGGFESEHKPRCDGRVALADAVVALTANLAMQTKQRINFKSEWFDAESDAAPEKEFPVA